jgi:hypothetical protein
MVQIAVTARASAAYHDAEGIAMRGQLCGQLPRFGGRYRSVLRAGWSWHGPSFAVMALLACVLASGTVAARAANFRIDTKIYVEDDSEPVGHNLTLFRAGIVYDFLAAPAETAVFKRSAEGGGRFILLDPARKLRSEISTQQIVAFLAELRNWAAMQKDPLLKFAAAPQFEEHFDPTRGTLRLESDVMRYELQTIEAKNPDALAIYRQFSDWYGRLGAVTHVGSTPPFPRLAVNAALARHGRLPESVRLVIEASKPYRTKPLVIRAEHQISWRLSRHDQQRIDELDEQLVNFRAIPYAQYRREQ